MKRIDIQVEQESGEEQVKPLKTEEKRRLGWQSKHTFSHLLQFQENRLKVHNWIVTNEKSYMFCSFPSSMIDVSFSIKIRLD